MSFNFIIKLPEHVQKRFLEYLSAKELSIFSLVCKSWREISNNDLVWHQLCIKHNLLDYEYLHEKSSHSQVPIKSSSTSPSPIFLIQNNETLVKLCKWKQVFVRAKHLHKNWTKGCYTVGTLLKGHKGRISTFDSDGKFIISASSDECLIKMWSIDDCDCLYTLKSPINSINSLKIHKDCFFIGGDDGLLIILNKNTGDQLKRISVNKIAILKIKIHENNIILILGDKSIRIFSLEKYEYLHVLRGHEDEIESFDCYGHFLATGSWCKRIILWNLQTGVKLQTLFDHLEVINCVKMRLNKVVSGSSDGTIKIWSITSNAKDCYQIQTLVGHESDVQCLDINDELIASGGSDSLIIVWNYEGERLHTMRGHLGVVRYLFMDNYKLISAGDAKKIIVWDYKNGRMLNSLHRNPNKLHLMWSNDTCIITASPESESILTLILYW